MAALTSDIQSMVDCGFPVAQLSIISLAKLNAKDAAEIGVLERAASTVGFFYLDLRGDPQGDHVLAHLPAVYAVAEKYFGQLQSAKAKDTRFDIKAGQDLGYQKNYGGESFEISRDEIASMGNSILHLPQAFQDEWTRITEISVGCDQACLTLLNSLSTDYAKYHRPDHPSDSGLKLVLYPSLTKVSDAPDTTHTDDGTFTLLFYKDWSISTLLPETNSWAFTAPIEGCALVNVANTLQRLSRGTLHSPKHRVTQPFDEAKNRYYLSYFLRPETVLLEKWDARK
ncbi:related to gibberellin 20-oxidase [Rhynchosporium secalis]|uniref:Related to gibberellin 20-oxidase n=1 Tax=Rhynchosporium secalis TaxID=38038 RepID=A0A1E1MUS5_RHYSE|nr:related to gibberellin 20-oxidase [Rhynchosporium secalis]